jgi:hypothetical protein
MDKESWQKGFDEGHAEGVKHALTSVKGVLDRRAWKQLEKPLGFGHYEKLFEEIAAEIERLQKLQGVYKIRSAVPGGALGLPRPSLLLKLGLQPRFERFQP